MDDDEVYNEALVRQTSAGRRVGGLLMDDDEVYNEALVRQTSAGRRVGDNDRDGEEVFDPSYEETEINRAILMSLQVLLLLSYLPVPLLRYHCIYMYVLVTFVYIHVCIYMCHTSSLLVILV